MNNQKQEIIDLEKLIISNYSSPIRIKGLLRKRKETLEEFLTKFITDWNLEKDTIYVETGIQQTDAGRRRSLGDIYMICKYYYKNITLNEVLNLLYNILKDNIDTGYRTCYCSTIKKRVWYYDENSEIRIFNEDQNDEYGNKYQFYLDNIINEKI